MSTRSFSVRLSRGEIEQMLWYVVDREQGNDAGWYVGNKESFEARHRSIKEKLETVLRPYSTADQPGAVQE